MRGIKRSCAFLLALCIIFAGCGKKAESKSETSETSETTTVSEIETTTSETSAKTEGSASYADKLFTTDKVHTINIELSDEDWADLKENPKSKTKYEANITIDGETLENVSFATKGNTSLSSVADDEDSDRYSFKVNFGKFTDGQTYYGLDKLYLNNIYADATYMKDYLSYRIFSEAGIESPLVSYVSLTVNGENAGLYIAIEEISESYLARTANGEGELYKP
ncbi:MAG: CotH kinase family protein, partial [Ruminococcus sp.]|nr:CotH kinase family protein [Ruminococcus sp.]